jgi:hypothetical protein
MATGITDYSKYVAIIVSLLALGYTIWKDRKMNKRIRKVEKEQEREKAEAEIRRSKASAPYFSPSKKMVGQLYEITDEGGLITFTGKSYRVKEAPGLTPENKKKPEVQRTFDRRGRELGSPAGPGSF